MNVAANKIATVNLTSRIVNDKLQGISTTTSYTYDSYGYPLTESVSYSDGATCTTSYKYSHSTSTSSLYRLGAETDRVITTTRNGDTYTERYLTPVWNSLKLPIVEVKYKDGNQVHERHFTYDDYGNVVKQEDKPYSASSFLSETYEYDNSGRLTKETDQFGLSTEYSYNTYGQMASSVDKYGKITTYSYDGLGRKTSTRHPDGITETTQYAWTTEGTNGCYSVTESVTGKPTVKTIYDALNREVRKTTTRFDGTASNTDKTYDMYGRLEKESYPFIGSSATSWNSYSYDSYDRMTKSVIQGVTTSYSYSGTSVTSTVDGTSVTKTKDAQGNLISVTDDTGTLTYNLKADGQPSSIVSPTGVTTTFTYDKWRRSTDTNDPSLGHTVKYYNSAGLLDIFTDAQGRAMSYGYDAYLRITSKSVVYGQTTAYTYDQYNNVKEINTNNGTKTLFTYDSYGRMTSSMEYADADVWLKKDFTYSNGNVSSVKYTSQTGVLATENYTYQNGYLVEVKNGTKSIYKINAVDAYGNVTGATAGGLVFNNGYTAYGNIASIRTSTGGSSALSHLILGYDAAKHRLISRRDNVRNITESFEYDCLDRLTKYGTNTVDYDDNGNITAKSDAGTFTYGDTKPYAVNGLNAVANIPSEQQDITYTQFYRPNTITQGRYSAEFVYNGDYDRVKMAVTDNGNACLTRYYLGGCYEMDITPSGTKEKLYLNGDYYDATSVIIKEGSSSILYYIVRDNIGSITHIVDEVNNIVQELSYDAWGRLRNPATYTVYRADEEPILLLGRGYTGHEHLQMFGLINMNARLYDPVLGRFLSPDPYIQNSDMSQNFNRYSYCMNSPLMYVDKNGEFFWLIGGLVGGLINWGVNGFQFNSEGLAYFGVGAVAGIAASFGIPTVAVAAMSGFANSVVNQGFTNGWGNINFGQAAFSGIIDGAFATLSAGISTFITKPVSSLTTNIKSPLLREFISHELVGIPTGAVLGGVMAEVDNNPETSFLDGMWKGAKTGAYVSGLSAIQSAVQYSRHNNVNFLTGEKIMPKQIHHFATNKNSTFTPDMEKIVKKYDLDLDGDWNKESLPHQGRHPNAYHQWVLEQMRFIDSTPGMNQQQFVKQFRLRVIEPVHNNPKMLRKGYWK
ncbi:MAG: RHS repeat-associated core domain-containing protein [Elusimicrobiales bacterium]|nr:RHS repeat-associated core domain-containing protein [Elusimicrobiales bacterium]